MRIQGGRSAIQHPERYGSISLRVIDTHCHLTFPDYAPDRHPGGIPAVLAEAERNGVRGMITISTTTQDCFAALDIARRFENVWCSAGVHPLYADRGPHDWRNLAACARDPKCVAWGELGLDNHYREPAGELQRAVLEEQLAFLGECRDHGLVKPVILHCREAFGDLIPILKRTSFPGSSFVFHCFTGTPADVRMALDFGAYVSFTGVVTYRNAQEVRDAAMLVPADRILVETDAPFLSPDPHRGKRPCMPWMSSVTAKFLAELRGVKWGDFERQLDENTEAFFGIRVGAR
jgi:TatD DNase family protein